MWRFLPSNLNGLVTTATVSAPSSLARLAMTGAAPVPVPPPRPVVTKIMSAPSSDWMISSVSSSAAWRPIIGSAPAPRPLVSLAPICSLTVAAFMRSACTSVLATMNSTPSRPVRTIRLTALPPPPPTPITLMRAPALRSTSRCSLMLFASLLPSCGVLLSAISLAPVVRPSAASEELPEQTAQPSGRAHERAGADRRPRRFTHHVAVTVEHEADAGRERRAVHVVGATAHAGRRAAADPQIEDLLSDLRHAVDDVVERDAEFVLVLRQHGIARRELLDNVFFHRHAGAVDARHDVLRRALAAGDDVDIHLEARAGHADGRADAVLLVDDEILRQHVENLTARRQRDGLCGVDRAPHAPARALAVPPVYPDHAAALEP